MKRIAVLFLVAFILAIVVSSCNKQTCPAYSKADVEQRGQSV